MKNKKKRLFCELGPTAYAISLRKQIIVRKIQNLLSGISFAGERREELLPEVVYSHSSGMIKRGPGIDPQLQRNKADNIALACSRIDRLIVSPGETFSFWRLVGKTSRRDALAPDPEGVRVPYSAGTSVNYNFLDLRFRNDTDRPVQVVARCEGDNLVAELRTTEPFDTEYRIIEEDHHFHRSESGNYYRISRIYRETIDRASGAVTARELKWDNRSRVMFDPAMIPPGQLR